MVNFLNRQSLLQFMRFVVVGFLNTAIDFGILNFLIWVFGIAWGWPVIIFNGVAVVVAMTNSYFLNKHWTFHKKETKDRMRESVLFVVFTALGMMINTGIVYYFSTYLDPMFGIDSVSWLNIGKVLATGVSLFWNFFWYKFVVFQSSSNEFKNPSSNL